MKTINEIRSEFLNFFGANSHNITPSSSLVPHNDPTLMFTNAGMNQFKNVFTGLEQLPYKRAASSQKCVRAGGKHNDLENVGYTARHHTFFEMLGNFSFGDYFKDDAIFFAWELLTKTFGLPKEKLLVTVYHTDDEAHKIWKKVAGLSDDKIIRIDTNDNFWSMGDTGPCGPCSEIFYDHGDKVEGDKPGTAGADGDRFIEIWNLVFMQHEKRADGTQVDLPKPSIDTGMGLERVAAVLQGVHNNYDTDLFKDIITATKQYLGGGEEASYRVIADHLRSSSFLIADGVMPSNEGRGYVLRRIMRRAMRHAHQLGARHAVMHSLVPALVRNMGVAFPELKRAEALIIEMLKLEEERFRETLGRGLKLLEDEKSGIKNKTLSGEVAFKLYDTYGFPLDLTADILRREGIKVDVTGFEKAMAEQKARAKAAWKGSGEKATEEVWFDIKQEFGATEFLGYTANKAEGQVLAIVKNGARSQVAHAGEEVQIITNQTPFYGESGGQAGDKGVIKSSKAKISVTDTLKKLGEVHVHLCKIEDGRIELGDNVELEIDVNRRTALRANHSATHLLHKVLHEVLGAQVTQKGSLVAEDKLRFDFNHNKSVSAEEIIEIETRVNNAIRANNEVHTVLMKPEEAIEKGAMALFGEKYGDEVRVLTMGNSVELCGGTHVQATGDIGLFKITSESAIAAGIRRIEAVTGAGAVKFVQEQSNLISGIAGSLKIGSAEIETRISGLLEEKKQLEKELAEARKKAALGGSGAPKFTEEKIGEYKFLSAKFDGLAPNDLRQLVEEFRQKDANSIIAAFAINEGKISIITAVGDAAKAKISATDLVKIAVEETGGKGGGGKPELAQGGGVEASKTDSAIQKIKAKL